MNQSLRTKTGLIGKVARFASATVLVAGIAGCTNITNNNYYFAQDGGTQPTAMGDMAQTPMPDLSQLPDMTVKCTPVAPSCIALNNLKADNGTYTVTDKQTGYTYTQKVTATSNMNGSITYHAEFADGNGNGIPVCAKPDINGSFATCPTSDSNWVSSHKVEIEFLGSKYIISGMTIGMNGENELILAKESVSGIVNISESLPLSNCLKVRVDDLEAHGDTTSAIIAIVDANGNVLLQDTISPGATATETVSGQQYRIHVNKVAPGYTFGARWSDISVFSEEVVLVNGKDMQVNGQVQPGFKVNLTYDMSGRLLSLDITIPQGAKDICQ